MKVLKVSYVPLAALQAASETTVRSAERRAELLAPQEAVVPQPATVAVCLSEKLTLVTVHRNPPGQCSRYPLWGGRQACRL